MSGAIEGNHELDDIDEDDLRSPLILEPSQKFNTSKGSAFFQFPVVSPRRSILLSQESPAAHPISPYSWQYQEGTQPPCPILPCSTPLPVHKVQARLSTCRAVHVLPSYTVWQHLVQEISVPQRSSPDGLLPLVSIVSTLVNVLQIFLTGETILGCAGLVISAFPTVLVLFYYLENMFHREKKLLEMGLIMIFGPFLRWLCSVRLLSFKLRPSAEDTDLEDIQRFAFATKVIDGIFEASVQIIWLLYSNQSLSFSTAEYAN
jgi:hypothetical protein